MKKLIVLALLFPIFVGSQVSAHVLKTDGSIGAILHIKPDDNPRSGVPTNYELNFRDTKNEFLVKDCDCRLALSSSEQLVSSQNLKANGDLIGGNTLTFPKNGIYELTVTGQPKSGASFTKFEFSYTVRVGGKAETSREVQSIPPLLWIGMASFIGLVLLGATRLDRV